MSKVGRKKKKREEKKVILSFSFAHKEKRMKKNH